jgi:hypothetical protein
LVKAIRECMVLLEQQIAKYVQAVASGGSEVRETPSPSRNEARKYEDLAIIRFHMMELLESEVSNKCLLLIQEARSSMWDIFVCLNML